MTAEPVDQLASALDATGEVIAAVGDEEWSKPTPCEGWNVADLVNHLVGGNHLFASVLAGTPPAGPAGLPRGDRPLRAYRDSADALVDAFRRPGALDKVVQVPLGSVPGIVALHLRITEVLVHGWDLSRALGRPAAFLDDIAEQELRFTRARLADVPPGRSPFAPPRPVADEAPAIDRLAACLGRDVTSSGPLFRSGS